MAFLFLIPLKPIATTSNVSMRATNIDMSAKIFVLTFEAQRQKDRHQFKVFEKDSKLVFFLPEIC